MTAAMLHRCDGALSVRAFAGSRVWAEVSAIGAIAAEKAIVGSPVGAVASRAECMALAKTRECRSSEAEQALLDRRQGARPRGAAAVAAFQRLARSDVMDTPEGREVMLRRHEIVVRIIDVNSRALRIENEINGLDIERRIAERELSASAGDEEKLAAINAKIADLDAERQKLSVERTWLEHALDELDGARSGEATDAAHHGPRRNS